MSSKYNYSINKKTLLKIITSHVRNKTKTFKFRGENKKFIEKFPNTLFTYIPDYDSKKPIIHSEILDLNRQQEGYGIYLTVNGFTGGKRTGENLQNINGFFCDIDYPDKVNRTKEDINQYKNDILMELYEEGVTPTFIVETKNGVHVYWMLESPIFLDQLNPDQQNELRIRYRQIEEALLERFDGDPGAKDIARVLRVPGTLHQKDPKDPFECKLVHFAIDNLYKFSDIQEAFLKKPAPIGWAVAAGENPISPEVKQTIEKEYPLLERDSYKKLFSKKEGSIPEGMRNKALLVAAYAAKDSGWSIEQTFEHFNTFHGLSLREIRKTIRSAYQHNYDFGYNNEVMNAMATTEERQKLSTVTSKALSVATKDKREASNYAQKQMFQTYEYIIAERFPNLKYKNRGDFYDYANGVYKSKQVEEVKSLILSQMLKDGLLNFRTTGKVNDKIACFKSIDGKTFNHEDENPNPDILNFSNGLLDIGTYIMYPHSPDYLSTSQIPINYDHSAQCPLWNKFISEITSDDPEQALLLQQIAGYVLTNDTRFAKAFIFFGSGANGKSLFTRMIAKLVGKDYVSSLSLSTITKQFGLTGLIGKKLNLVDEISGNYFESNIIKNLISGEKMVAEIKFRPEPIEFTPIAKLIFSVNELPKINDTTPGLYRRFLIVPFLRTFINNPDLDLENKLSQELPGILNWAIEGLKKLREQGRFNETKKNVDAINEFKIENSPFLEFLTNHYEPVPNQADWPMHKITVNQMYSEYRNYCFDAGYRPKSTATFLRELSHTVLPGWKMDKNREGRHVYIYGVRSTQGLGGAEVQYPGGNNGY